MATPLPGCNVDLRDTAPRRPSPRAIARRLAIVLLTIAVVTINVVVPPGSALADPLSDAIAQQRALQQQINAQKAKVAELGNLQGHLGDDISATQTNLT